MVTPELYVEILAWLDAVILVISVAVAGGVLGTAAAAWERRYRQRRRGEWRRTWR